MAIGKNSYVMDMVLLNAYIVSHCAKKNIITHFFCILSYDVWEKLHIELHHV
jgi:hypothetical protein